MENLDILTMMLFVSIIIYTTFFYHIIEDMKRKNRDREKLRRFIQGDDA